MDYSIVYIIGESIQSMPTVYPDTSLDLDTFSFKLIIEPGETADIIKASSVKISEIIEDLPADTLSVYLFHIDTLKNNTWAEVQAGYKILKRYDLSLEDLEHLEYKLSYPPDAKMSGVKMYPPYP